MAKSYIKDGTKWTPAKGVMLQGKNGQRRVTFDEDDIAVSNFEPKEILDIPIGTKVSFDYGNPAEHRVVAINVKPLPQMKRITKAEFQRAQTAEKEQEESFLKAVEKRRNGKSKKASRGGK